MHNCLRVHESQALEALPENALPPVLGHAHPLLPGAHAQSREVSSVVALVDHIIANRVLEDLECLGDPLTTQQSHRLEFLFQVFHAGADHRLLPVSLDADLIALAVRSEHHEALAAFPEFLRDAEASFRQGLQWDVDRRGGANLLCLPFAQSELHKLVNLVQFQPPGAAEVEAHHVFRQITKSLSRNIGPLEEEGAEAHQFGIPQFIHPFVNDGAEAPDDKSLELVAVSEQRHNPLEEAVRDGRFSRAWVVDRHQVLAAPVEVFSMGFWW
mmetsp:Transcript_98276/g.277900  ORF Transcript_98276/g.277900 Transcript_98276/m.277900 type:complete len:270 (+) Transcript_98276:838-1647(+)